SRSALTRAVSDGIAPNGNRPAGQLLHSEGFVIAALIACLALAAPPAHVVVFHQRETFAGWPANGGLWAWDAGQEVVVGFETGRFEERKGHNITGKHTNVLARTTDGGQTWVVEKPVGYYQEGVKAKPLTGPLAFTAPGFAMRIVASGYGVA